MKTVKDLFNEVTKTEHSGAKKGKGAFYGKKKDAKKTSNKQRRTNSKKAVNEASYQELQTLGYNMNTDKGDGRHASISGKNYALGYWKKKLEQASGEGDKLGMKIAKLEICKREKKKENKKLEESN